MRTSTFPIVVSCLLVAACSGTVYKDQIASLGTAEKSLSTASAAYDDIKPGDWGGNALLGSVANGDRLTYYDRCDLDAKNVQMAIDAAAVATGAVPDDAMKQYAATVRRCDVAATTVDQDKAAAGGGHGANPAAAGGHGADGDKADDSSASAAELQRAEGRLAAACADIRPVSVGPPSKAPSAKSLMTALDRYLAALQAITDASSVSDLQKNEKAASSGVDGLLKAANGPASAGPAADLVFALFDIALEQERYNALKSAVLGLECTVHPQVSAIETAMKASLRVKHGALIFARAVDAQLAATYADKVLNMDGVIHNPGVRLILFQQIQTDVAAKNNALTAAIKADPGATVAAFFDAHHKLALALVDPTLQMGPVFDSLSTLSTAAQALDKAINPPAKGAK